MIELPLQCKLAKTVDTQISVNLVEFTVNNVKNVKGVPTNPLSETIAREYVNLTLNELAVLETAFDNTNGTTRLLYDNKRWLVNGYVSYYNPPYKLTLSLVRTG